MLSWSDILSFAHLFGMALGVGGATVKIVLRLKANADVAFLPIYARVSKPVTIIIVLGTILLTLSGAGWLFYGYSFTPLIIAKIILIGVMWILGPVIDNVAEPRFLKLIPADGETPSREFAQAARLHLVLDSFATLLMYALMVLGTRI